MRFLAIQFEFTHGIGPQPGRYLVAREGREVPERAPNFAPGGDADVLVVSEVSAPRTVRPALLRRSRMHRIADDLGPVPVITVNVIFGSQPLGDDSAARETFLDLRASLPKQDQLIEEALEIVNRAVRAHRAAWGDPYVGELTPYDARVTRLGYGTGAELIANRWSEAVVSEARDGPSGNELLRPSAVVAAVLAGRARILESEELILRSALDLDRGRPRLAAIQLAHAVDLLLQELEGEPPDAPATLQIEELRSRRPSAATLSSRALRNEVGESDAELIKDLLTAVAAVVHSWRAGKLGNIAPRGAREDG